MVTNSFLQKLSTWATEKSNTSTRIDFLLLKITMCSAFNRGCGYDNSAFTLIGDVCCPKTKFSGKLCRHKKIFESLGRTDYQSSHCASVCRMSNIPFEDQTSSFFLSFGQGVHFFEESPKSIQDVIGDVYCPGKFCFYREKCESLGGFVTTPRSIYGCGKCGAWLFVQKIPFIIQEHVKTTQTDRTGFFFVKKRLICYPTNICSIRSLLGTIPHQSQSCAPKRVKLSTNME